MIFRCQYDGCNRSFPTQSLLARHIRTHNGEKPYQCKICGKSFTLQGNLNKHVKAHDTSHLRWNRSTNDKPYKCPIEGCARSFTAKSSLQSHLQCHHNVLNADLSKYDTILPTSSVMSSPEKNSLNFNINDNQNAHQNNNNASSSNSNLPIQSFCLHDGCKETFTSQQDLRQHIYSSAPGVVAEVTFLKSTLLDVLDIVDNWDMISSFDKDKTKQYFQTIRDAVNALPTSEVSNTTSYNISVPISKIICSDGKYAETISDAMTSIESNQETQQNLFTYFHSNDLTVSENTKREEFITKIEPSSPFGESSSSSSSSLPSSEMTSVYKKENRKHNANDQFGSWVKFGKCCAGDKTCYDNNKSSDNSHTKSINGNENNITTSIKLKHDISTKAENRTNLLHLPNEDSVSVDMMNNNHSTNNSNSNSNIDNNNDMLGWDDQYNDNLLTLLSDGFDLFEYDIGDDDDNDNGYVVSDNNNNMTFSENTRTTPSSYITTSLLKSHENITNAWSLHTSTTNISGISKRSTMISSMNDQDQNDSIDRNTKKQKNIQVV